MGSPAIPDLPPMGELGGKAKSLGPAKTKSPKAHVPAKPPVTASAGPDGYKAHCVTMTPTQLNAAYKSEYQSWKDGKSRCKKKKWPWASEWESFKGFLLSMDQNPQLRIRSIVKTTPLGRTAPVFANGQTRSRKTITNRTISKSWFP